MLTQTIRSASHMRDEFQRHDRKDQYSYRAYDALFDHLSDLGVDIEFDVVAICCEWCEYGSIAELAEAYGEVLMIDVEDSDLRAEIENHGTVLDVEGGGVLFSE